MSDELLILCIFTCVDDIVQRLSIDPHPGPEGQLSLSEVITLMVLHPLLKPGWTLKGYWRWLEWNLKEFFPGLVEYSRMTRLFKQAQEYVVVIQQRLANLNSFGLVADGTPVSVMETVRGKYAKSFREGRKVKSASKNQWYWGFILELVIAQQGFITHFSLDTSAEVKQLENILEDLANRWVLADRGNRGKKMHERLWDDKQIAIKITGGKERQWIENVIDTLKNRLGLGRIRKIRKTPGLLARLKAILCCYNLVIALHLPI